LAAFTSTDFLQLAVHDLLHNPPKMENNQEADPAKYIDNAMRAVREKKPLPEIDFTLHTMEDGSQVSTQERVCKGMLDAGASGQFLSMKTAFRTPLRVQ
jgi:hypothetical protein